MIIVDTNTAENQLFEGLKAEVCTGDGSVVDRRRLDLGDVELRSEGSESKAIVIERKTTADFAASFVDGRYKQQKERMLRAGDLARPTQFVYLIESSGAPLTWNGQTGHVNNRALHAALVKMQLRDGLAVLHSRGGQDSVQLIAYLHTELISDRLEVTTARAAMPTMAVVSRKRGNLESGRSMYVAMLSALPGVSITTATAIADAYPAIALLGATSAAELANTSLGSGRDNKRVRRLGPALAKRIHQALDHTV